MKALWNKYHKEIVGALLSVGLTAVLQVFTKIKIWTWLGNVASWVYRNILLYEVKVWVLFIVLLGLYVLWVVVLNLRPQVESHPRLKDRLDTYTEDNILGLRYRWNWEHSYDNVFNIENLVAICNRCGTPMRSSMSYGSWTCPRCGNYQKQRKSDDDVKSIIIDNFNRNKRGV